VTGHGVTDCGHFLSKQFFVYNIALTSLVIRSNEHIGICFLSKSVSFIVHDQLKVFRTDIFCPLHTTPSTSSSSTDELSPAAAMESRPHAGRRLRASRPVVAVYSGATVMHVIPVVGQCLPSSVTIRLRPPPFGRFLSGPKRQGPPTKGGETQGNSAGRAWT
jgi:hypothetical protein